MLTINRDVLEKIGLISKAYNPAPFKAAIIDINPPRNWTTNVRKAMNLNSLFLYNNALGTILTVTKNKFTDNI